MVSGRWLTSVVVGLVDGLVVVVNVGVGALTWGFVLSRLD